MSIPPNPDSWYMFGGAKIVDNHITLSGHPLPGAQSYDDWGWAGIELYRHLIWGAGGIPRNTIDPEWPPITVDDKFDLVVKLVPQGTVTDQLRTILYLYNDGIESQELADNGTNKTWESLHFDTNIGGTEVRCWYTDRDYDGGGAFPTTDVDVATVVYDQATNPWIRIHISDGVLHWQYGPNGKTWIDAASVAWAGPGRQALSTVLYIYYEPVNKSPNVDRDAELTWSEYILNGVPIFGEVAEVEPPLGVFIKSSRGWIPLDAELA